MSAGSLAVIPSNRIFRKQFFLSLGQLAGFQPLVFVDHDLIIPMVIQVLGFDPLKLEQYGDPALGWRRKGIKTPEGFDRRVGRCFLQGFQNRQEAQTVKGPRRGLWGLTELGATLALSLEQDALATPPKPPKRQSNATAKFLEQRVLETGGVDGALYQRLRAALRSRLPISAVTSQVEDHVQNFFMKMISRDALRTRIEAGTEISNDHLAYYATNIGIGDCRTAGTDPVTRELYGARTERERRLKIATNPIQDPRVVWNPEGTGQGNKTWMDLVDVDSASTSKATMNQLQFNSIWTETKSAVMRKKPRVGNRFVNVLLLKAQGYTVTEIAEAEGVSPFRASAMIAEARRVVREASEEGSISKL